jgi:uncharacterized protein (DUF342 family)
MASQNWDIVQNPKNRRWYLEIKSGIAEEDYPDETAIRERASENGIDTALIVSPATIEKNLAKALSIPGEEFSFPVSIEPTFDVRIIVAPDKTSASLYIRKAADKRTEVDLKLVSAAINNSRIRGLDPAKIKARLTEFTASPEMELADYVLAESTPPKRGKNRELVAKATWLEEDAALILKNKLSEYLHQSGQTYAEEAFPVASAERLAFVEKGQIAFEISAAETGEPGADIYGKELPGLPGNDPFIQIVENLSLGKDGIRADKTGVLIASGTPDNQKLRIIPFLDSKITPVISPDDMTVTLIIEAGDGAGSQLSADIIPGILESKGIHGQIDLDSVARTIAEVNETKVAREIVVLRGVKPVKPGSIRVTWFVHDPSDGVSICVNEGDKILSIEKFPSGADGHDVFGRKIPAADGIEILDPEHDDSVTVTTEKGVQTFTAATTGELKFSGGTITVSKTRQIVGNVDDARGDISFPGDIAITGNILAGRTVKATGSLTVNGNAAASLVSADSCVTMTGGISGAGRGVVWAKQEVRLASAENARILAGQNIYIDNYCFQCTVKTNGTIFMKGNPGVLLGGNVRASKGLEVLELGSEKTIRTSISFGQNYLVSDQIEVCEKESVKTLDMIARVDAEMQKTSNTDPRIHELRRKKLELMKRNEKLTVRIFTLKEQFETHILSHIRVEYTVYPGVILESHGRYYEVREQKHHVIFTFDQITGQIACKPID